MSIYVPPEDDLFCEIRLLLDDSGLSETAGHVAWFSGSNVMILESLKNGGYDRHVYKMKDGTRVHASTLPAYRIAEDELEKLRQLRKKAILAPPDYFLARFLKIFGLDAGSSPSE